MPYAGKMGGRKKMAAKKSAKKAVKKAKKNDPKSAVYKKGAMGKGVGKLAREAAMMGDPRSAVLRGEMRSAMNAAKPRKASAAVKRAMSAMSSAAGGGVTAAEYRSAMNKLGKNKKKNADMLRRGK